ncbi:MAG: alanine dehydrogenase [Bacteroidetes bacterium]|nr:MAG: alanine dehydrogenase [Bacteroidota bacterium]
MKIGIIKEGKTPPDSRVALTPEQCAHIKSTFGIEVVAQYSDVRAYKDDEYAKAGIALVEDVSDCDFLMGIKEVPIDMLIPEKQYSFFSHTIKKQSYNRKLLQAILEKNISLVDYEVLTDDKGRRLIAFGYYAGMVGAHNALYTYAQRSGAYEIKRLKDCFDYAEAKDSYKDINWPAIKIVLTGGGRVSSGAVKVLEDMGIEKVSPQDFLEKEFENIVFTQIDCDNYVQRKDGGEFSFPDFFGNPEAYESTFAPYARAADVMINGIFWDNKAPAFFTVEEMAQPDFKIKVIADVTCDIAPVSSIPSTLRASKISDPIFGFDPKTGKETTPHQEGVIDMMTIDNLPSEIPRDSSKAFGDMFIEHILPELVKKESDVIQRATIAENGQLGEYFEYLADYVKGLE